MCGVKATPPWVEPHMMRVPMWISLARAFVGGLAPLAPTTTRGMRSQTRRGGRRAAPYSDVAEACAALGRRAAELTRANTSPDLVVVPTPLGEPADLTVRAIAALAAADVVACEDTRVAGLLYEAAGIERKAAFVRHDAATLLYGHQKLGHFTLVTDLLDFFDDVCRLACAIQQRIGLQT